MLNPESGSPLSRDGCLSAARHFVNLGLEYILVQLLSTPHSGAIWLKEVPSGTEYLADVHNVGIRPGKYNTGVFTGFFCCVTDDLNMQIPMRQTDTYKYLQNLGTLSFESGSTAAFLLKGDRFTHVTEHQTNEWVAVGPLKGARLVVESGVVGWGMLYDYDRSHRITCEGPSGPLHVRDLPELLDILRATGHVTASGYNGGVFERGDVSGPTLL